MQVTKSSSVVSEVESTIASSGLSVLFDPPVDGPLAGRYANRSNSSLHEELQPYVDSVCSEGLYTHQHLAIESSISGQNTIAATRTSSGKSLIFSLPAIDAICRDANSTSLFLYPQKALANDQLAKLQVAIGHVPSIRRRAKQSSHFVSRYDGATPQDDRKQIREQVQLLLTNPDMLHLGILQHHQNHWSRFFANLKYVAIDECHEYRGIFGTNVAYVLRRLRQVCSQHGSNPRFIATSATIADPQEHLRKLVGCDFELIGPEEDGSRQGMRKFWMLGGVEHAYESGRKLAISLIERGLNVIVFCPSRITAERMLSKMRTKNGDLDERVAVYRSGLTANEREEIEAKLRTGEKKLVFSTSALELGIDIGSLDVVICLGLPNSMMSLWQRAGRVARGGRDGAIILLPSESPRDAYYAKHPEELFTRDNESLALNMNNERVSCQHYACAVHETGSGEQGLLFNQLGEQIELIQQLRDDGKLDRPEFFQADPHIDVSLRNTGEVRYQLVNNQETIGEIGSFHLLREAARDSLYKHNGRTYRVKDVVKGRQIVRVVPEFTNNETVSFVQKSIKQRQALRIREYTDLTITLARLDVSEYLKAVTEKDASGKTVRVYQPTGMPIHRLPTEGVAIAFSESLLTTLRKSVVRNCESAVAAIERLSAQLFPTLSGPCDPQDYSSATDRTKSGSLAIYLYDNVYDGVNLTECIFERVPELLCKVRMHIEQCTCTDDTGCIRCVLDAQRDSASSKSDCLLLLNEFLSRMLEESPRSIELGDRQAFEQIELEIECSACHAKISPDSKFCSECGHKQTGDSHANS